MKRRPCHGGVLVTCLIVLCAAGPIIVTPTARAAPTVRLDPPEGLAASRVEPRQDEARRRAAMTLQHILDTLAWPTFLQPDRRDPDPDRPEPPLAAQRAYVAGRQALRERRNFEAIQKLRSALAIAPNEPRILSLLGRIYTAAGNRAQGAVYLERAVRQDPGDVDGLYLLGRYAFERGLWDNAIVTLARCLEMVEPDDDPAIRPLAAYFLASALERQGYDAELVRHFGMFLDEPARLNRTTRLFRDWALLNRQRDEVHLAVGDALNRLDRPAEAMELYGDLAFDDVAEPAALLRRILYTRLRVKDTKGALASLMDYLAGHELDASAIRLVGYLKDNGVAGDQMVARLRTVYRENNRSGALALSLVELMDEADAYELLDRHLAERPQDRQVFDALMRRLFAGGRSAEATTASGFRAVRTTVKATGDQARLADAYAASLLQAVGAPARLKPVFEGWSWDRHFEGRKPTKRDRAALLYLKGRAMVAYREAEAALETWRQALQIDPTFTPARVDLARGLIATDKAEAAEKVLEPLADSRDAEVVGLRVRLLESTDRADEALALLNRQLTDAPRNVDMLLDKAGLQLKMGDSIAAERTLLDALNAQPTEERLYSALFNLYESENPPPDHVRQYQRLLRRIINTIPTSRIARLERSKLLRAQRLFDQAETLLRGLLSENPDDRRALGLLLENLTAAGRTEDAGKLLTEQLEKSPDDLTLLLIARAHYARIRDHDRLFEVTRRIIMREPPSLQRARAMASLFLSNDMPEKAVKVLEDAVDGDMKDFDGLVSLLGRALIEVNRVDELEARVQRLSKRFPEHRAEVQFEWAMVFERIGRSDRAEQVMLKILEHTPNHPATNNGLGYAWADKGRNLDRALKMIQLAVEADPTNSAYLDSLGWVHYKLGHFEEAAKWLKRASAEPGGEFPVIVDHLGDALYRLGDTANAVRYWSLAQRQLQNLDVGDDPELKGLDQKLLRKIDAIRKQLPAPVADAEPAPGGPEKPGEKTPDADSDPPAGDGPGDKQ